MQRKRVVIVDDSPTMRAMIGRVLKGDGRFEVVGEAADPFEARDVIKQTNPDVITLDVEMPRMDGITFLEKIMRLRPMPVVMFSTETHRGSRAAVEALSLGAIDCIGKPSMADAHALQALADRVFVAAGATVARARDTRPSTPAEGSYSWNGRVVLIGASTGGVDALERVLGGMPANGPPILITQHMPETFLASFAERLQGLVAPSVGLAQSGGAIRQGHIYLAPGGVNHLVVEGRKPALRCGLQPGEKVSGHRPSVDVLLSSALALGKTAVGVLLTGMGRDGAEGMRSLRQAGAHTIAQDEATSVVYGMPRVASELGGVAEIQPIDKIASAILRATGTSGSADCRGADRPAPRDAAERTDHAARPR
ncbi:MAG: chemotaxis response regulator protein-glutamate methylesterase [Pseudomonadota bacterium]